MSSSGISNVFGLVDTFGGVPVNAAQVLLFDAEGSRVYKQSTASDGSFGIPEVQPGDGTHLIADAVNVSSGATTSSIDASQ